MSRHLNLNLPPHSWNAPSARAPGGSLPLGYCPGLHGTATAAAHAIASVAQVGPFLVEPRCWPDSSIDIPSSKHQPIANDSQKKLSCRCVPRKWSGAVRMALPKPVQAASKLLALSVLGVALLGGPLEVRAISGGGKDFAEAKIEGQDFHGKDYSGKDFSGAFATSADFHGATLKGARFYKAGLRGANFEGADLTGASLEGAALDGTSFKDAILEGTYFTQTLEKVSERGGHTVLLAANRRVRLAELTCMRWPANSDPPGLTCAWVRLVKQHGMR
jgi:hypothetical protein